jgi:predicted nucleotidyltransferase
MLRARAKDVAAALGRKYGVTRVVLFGGVAREDPTLPGDVDLYVEGLRPERWIAACTEADEMMGDIHADLVPAESAHASVRESVMAEGKTLYEVGPE